MTDDTTEKPLLSADGPLAAAEPLAATEAPPLAEQSLEAEQVAAAQQIPSDEQPPASARKPWSAAKALEAFMFRGSERFSAALVLGLSAAVLMPPPSAQETFAAAVPQDAVFQQPSPQKVEVPPIQLAESKHAATIGEAVPVKPKLKGRPKVTLKDRWAKSKNTIVLRATKNVPREDIASRSILALPILIAKAPEIQIEVRTAKQATAMLNAEKPEEVLGTPSSPEEKPILLNVWPEETVKAARASCEILLNGKFVKYRFLEPIKQGACGTPAPIALQSAGKAEIAFPSPLTINCETAAALADWIDNDVQPAAKEAFGVQVKRLQSASSYSCRHRYGRKDAPWSEHASANAIDIFGFVLADGRTIKVAEAWGPTERDAKIAAAKPALPDAAKSDASSTTIKAAEAKDPEVELLPRHPDYKRQQFSRLGAQDIAAAVSKKSSRVTGGPRVLGALQQSEGKNSQFLKRIHGDACGVFRTVLGPEANNAHRDHLHLDMKPRRSAYCE